MFNSKKLAILPFADFPLKDAAGEIQIDPDTKQPLTITMWGPGSKQYQKAKHASEQRNNDRALAAMQGGDERQTMDQKITESAEFLAACTKSFNGFAYEDMTGYEGFKAQYSDIEVGHIADDARKFLNSRANFLPKSASPSVSTSDTQPG